MQKLTAMLFGDPKAAREDASTDADTPPPENDSLICEPWKMKDFGFHRTYSDDGTTASIPFSRQVSLESECHEEWTHVGTPVHHPEAPPTVIYPHPVFEKEDHEGEIIAVSRDGTARFIAAQPESPFLLDEDEEEGLKSSLVLVHPDGRAFFVERGNNVDWDEVCGPDGAAKQVARFEAKEYHRIQKPTVTSGLARALKPLGNHGPTPAPRRLRAPEGSVPRSPSLKRLARNLFPDDVQPEEEAEEVFYRRATPSSTLARALSPLHDLDLDDMPDEELSLEVARSPSMQHLSKLLFHAEVERCESPCAAVARAISPLSDACFDEDTDAAVPSDEPVRSDSLWKLVQSLFEAEEPERCTSPSTAVAHAITPLEYTDITDDTTPPKMPRSPSLRQLSDRLFEDEPRVEYCRWPESPVAHAFTPLESHEDAAAAAPSTLTRSPSLWRLARFLFSVEEPERLRSPSVTHPHAVSPLEGTEAAASPKVPLPRSPSLWSLTKALFTVEQPREPRWAMPASSAHAYSPLESTMNDPFDVVDEGPGRMPRSPSLRQLAQRLFEAEGTKTPHQGALNLAAAASIVVARRRAAQPMGRLAAWCCN